VAGKRQTKNMYQNPLKCSMEAVFNVGGYSVGSETTIQVIQQK